MVPPNTISAKFSHLYPSDEKFNSNCGSNPMYFAQEINAIYFQQFLSLVTLKEEGVGRAGTVVKTWYPNVFL